MNPNQPKTEEEKESYYPRRFTQKDVEKFHRAWQEVTEFKNKYGRLPREKLPLTRVETEILNDIKAFYKQFDYMPTMAELAKKRGVIHATIQYYLNLLEKKGWIERIPHASRSITLN